jgi:hypothetical protein
MGFLGHVKTVDGKLNDIETTRELASFTKIDDFNHLEFSTLENDLLIARWKSQFFENGNFEQCLRCYFIWPVPV